MKLLRRLCCWFGLHFRPTDSHPGFIYICLCCNEMQAPKLVRKPLNKKFKP